MLILGQKDTVDNQNSKGNVNRINLARMTSVAPVSFLLSKYLTNTVLFQCFIPAISKTSAVILMMTARLKDWMRDETTSTYFKVL